MTYAPASITALATLWQREGGRNLGIVGDSRHASRASYHNGRDRMVAYNRLHTDYTAMNVRDRSGLTNAASAIDLGTLQGGYKDLRTFSVWLVGRCRTNAPGTSDIREVIYTRDGSTVLRYDRERGVKSLPKAGEADRSHLWHTHISFYRDSEKRSKTGIFAPYFADPLPDTSTEEEVVIVVTIEKWPQPKRFRAPGNLRRFTATDELEPIDGPYEAWVDANVAIQSTGVPHGVGFLRLSSGGSAGKYVLASEVDLAA